MTRYVAGRVAQLLPVLFLVSALVFGIMHLLPGDPAELMLAGAEGGAITPERLAELKREMGLTDPLLVQFGRFLAGAATGDLGESIRYRVPVSSLIAEGFGSTLALAVSGLALCVLIGLPLGMAAAVRENGWLDSAAMGIAYLGASMPVYWVGLVLILVFSFDLGWFPPAGGDGPRASSCQP